MLDAVGIYGLRTASLVEALAADARPEVRLSTPVAAIEQRDQRVNVTARDGQAFVASAVVVAVPLNTLAMIDFAPALGSEKQAVADRGQASRGVKLWAHVRGELEPFFFMAPDDHPITFLVTETVLDDGSQLLVAFGPDAGRLPPRDDWEVRRAVGELLPGGAEIVAVTGHDWWRDEFSRGTWSVFRPGQLIALPALQAPHGRVVFAGSDLANGWNGFMDGAIESGLRAARSVAQVFKAAQASTMAP